MGPLTPAQRSAIRARVHLRVRPEYSSEAYGQPAYLQLSLRGPAEIAKGAADGSEMGAFARERNPVKEQGLLLKLREYMPAGLVPVLVYVT